MSHPEELAQGPQCAIQLRKTPVGVGDGKADFLNTTSQISKGTN